MTEIMMNLSWQQFLMSHGAILTEAGVQSFGDVAAENLALREQTILCDLSQFGTLRVSGEEAQSFLNNMLSSDVNNLAIGQVQYSSFNSAKGRVLATLVVARDDLGFVLTLPQSLVAAMHKKLSMFVFRSKVKLVDVSEQQVRLGLAGTHAAEVLQRQFGNAPLTPMTVVTTDNISVTCLAENRFQLEMAVDQAPLIWLALAAIAKPVASVSWDWLTIRAGVPVVLPATQEAYVLQMINLDLIGGVSFKKGCYPGQEIVARMHYLGKLKRRMYLAHIESDLPPQAGDELFSAEMEGQASGTIVNASAAPTGGYDVLAVLQIASRDTQSIHLASLTGPVLAFQSLPYSLP